MCLTADLPPDWLPDAGEGSCCYGAALDGPHACTCWVDVHDPHQPEQADPDPEAMRLLAAGVQPNTRDRMCSDCAYRPGSPERAGDPRYRGDAEFLEDLAGTGQRFWCHQGLSRRVGRTFTGRMSVPSGPGDYDPPIIDGIPYQLDGQPGLVCAGWAARHRALTALADRELARESAPAVS